MTIQSDMREFFNENGFFVCKSILGDSAEKAMSAIEDAFIHQLDARDLSTCEKSQPFTFGLMKTLYDANLDAYKATAAVLSRLLPVHKLMYDAEITDRLHLLGIKSPIVPTGPVVHVVSKDLKIPNGYFGQAPHQDWPSIQGSLDSVVVWAPLHDICRYLYPLEVIPGSHKRGLLPGKITKHQHITDSSEYSSDDFVPVEVQRGDVVFMSSWTVHKTSLQGPDEGDVRVACSIRYENLEEPTFVSRNYPSAYHRSVNREFITPDFPSKDQVEAVFK